MNFLIKGVENGGRFLLSDYGIKKDDIKLVWTILDEEKLFTQFDIMTGAKIKVNLDNVKPKHWESAFIEDRIHDWDIRGEYFYYYPHSSEIGNKQDILIICG